MRRATVLQRVEQEAEFLPRFIGRDAEQVENRTLGLGIVNTDRAAADFAAVEHHVVGPGQGRGGVVERATRCGKRMMQRLPALAFGTPPEHREVDNPYGPPRVFEQIEVERHPVAQGSEGRVDRVDGVRAEEDHVAVLGAGALENRRHDVVGQEFQDRRLQAVAPGGKLIDFDVGEPLRAVNRDKIRVVIELFAGQAATARRPHRRYATRRIVRRTGEHLEFDRGHDVAEFDELERIAQIGAVATVTRHRFGITQPRKRIGQGHIEYIREDRADHRFHEPHDIIFFDERHFDVELREFRLPVRAQVLVAKTAHDLVVAVEAGHHEQLLEQLR